MVQPLKRNVIGPRVRRFLSRRPKRDVPMMAVVQHVNRSTRGYVSRQAVEYHVYALEAEGRVKRKGSTLRWVPARG